MRDDGTMMRTHELWELAKKYNLKFITIKSLQDYCRIHEKHVIREACADFPNKYGHFKIYGYVNDITGVTCLLLLGAAAVFGLAPFGSATVVTDDARIQYIDLFAWLKQVLAGNDSITWSFCRGIGGNVWL